MVIIEVQHTFVELCSAASCCVPLLISPIHNRFSKVCQTNLEVGYAWGLLEPILIQLSILERTNQDVVQLQIKVVDLKFFCSRVKGIIEGSKPSLRKRKDTAFSANFHYVQYHLEDVAVKREVVCKWLSLSLSPFFQAASITFHHHPIIILRYTKVIS